MVCNCILLVTCVLCPVICELSSYPSKMNENRHSGMHSGGAPRGDWGDERADFGEIPFAKQK